MTEFISADALTALLQVALIDLVLAGDNAVVIGLAATGLPAAPRRRAIVVAIIAATALRIVFAGVATQLLQGRPRRSSLARGSAPEALHRCGIEEGGLFGIDKIVCNPLSCGKPC